MFGFIKNKLKKVYNQFTSKVSTLFSRETIDQEFLDKLTELLICADTGITTTNTIMAHLKEMIAAKKISSPQEIKIELQQQLLSILKKNEAPHETPDVFLLVGINGSGKTTFAGKLANKLKNERHGLASGKKILLVAGDTFRAAATQQLQEWGNKTGVDVFVGKENQSQADLPRDPASVVFDGCAKFVAEGYDHLIIDTAGRLQTKVNLLKELAKIKKIIDKKIPEQKVQTLLTVDAMLGQNSFEQAKVFDEATNLDGIILTKFDGTGKGGIVFAITNELHLPIIYVTFGEGLEAIKNFDPKDYVDDLLNA